MHALGSQELNIVIKRPTVLVAGTHIACIMNVLYSNDLLHHLTASVQMIHLKLETRSVLACVHYVKANSPVARVPAPLAPWLFRSPDSRERPTSVVAG